VRTLERRSFASHPLLYKHSIFTSPLWFVVRGPGRGSDCLDVRQKSGESYLSWREELDDCRRRGRVDGKFGKQFGLEMGKMGVGGKGERHRARSVGVQLVVMYA